MDLASEIEFESRKVNRNPTEAQKAAGTYRKGHVRVHGIPIAIENPRGSFRRGVDAGGRAWSVRMPATYGYAKGTEGHDGDGVDIYIGPHLKSAKAFVLDQRDAHTGKHDEDKAFIGFGSVGQVKATYRKAFSDGNANARMGKIVEMPIAEFREWVKSHKPVKRRADGGRVGYADGGTPDDKPPFDASQPFQPADAKPAFDPSKPFDAAPTTQATTTPKSEAKGLSSYLPDAITDIPHQMYEAGVGQVRNIGQAWNDIRARHAAQAEKDKGPDASFFDPTAIANTAKDIADVGKGVVSGASAIPAAVLQGPANSLIGHPMAAAEHIVGTIINPDVAARDNPETMFENAKSDVGTALAAARPRGFTPRGAITPPAAPSSPALANQNAADEFGIRLSRGQSTQDLDTIRYEDMAARGAYGKEQQDRAAGFFQKQFEDSQSAGRDVGDQAAGPHPIVADAAEAANAVHGEVADRAARARDLQAHADQISAGEADAQRGMVSDQGRALDDTIRGRSLPIDNPREAGEVVGQNVRDAATANRQEFRGLYDEFGRLPGEYRVDAVRGLGNRVQNDLTLRDNPIIIDDQLTPVASRAIRDLDQMSAPRIQNRADPRAAPDPAEISAVSLRGVDQMRKKLVSYYQAARASGPQGATDARAMQGIMDAFDSQIERAHTEGLFSGDPRALQALQEARASYSRYRRQFTPQGAGDDVGTAMRRIVERGATPEETANMIVGSGKIGAAGTPVRLYDRLEQTLGPDSDSVSAIRQAMWQKASQVRNAAGVIDPARSATGIDSFADSSLARRAFSPQELNAMRAHARSIRELDRNIEQMPATQTAERVRSAYQDVFGGRELGGAPAAAFRRMVEGTATPEEITSGLFKVIGAGNPGHVTRAIRAIENIVGEDSPTMSAVRQGVWQKLTQAAAGKDQPGAQKSMQAINEFLNGTGRTIAQHLYTPDQLALMDRYAKALKLTIIPKYARTNSDTAPAMLAAVRKYAGMVGTALGFMHGDGGLAGYGAGKALDFVSSKIQAGRSMRKLNDSLDNLSPTAPKPSPIPRTGSASRVLPLSVRGGPNIGAQIARLQGPVPSYADDKKQ